jgi:hypothetical protein
VKTAFKFNQKAHIGSQLVGILGVYRDIKSSMHNSSSFPRSTIGLESYNTSIPTYFTLPT